MFHLIINHVEYQYCDFKAKILLCPILLSIYCCVCLNIHNCQIPHLFSNLSFIYKSLGFHVLINAHTHSELRKTDIVAYLILCVLNVIVRERPRYFLLGLTCRYWNFQGSSRELRRQYKYKSGDRRGIAHRNERRR